MRGLELEIATLAGLRESCRSAASSRSITPQNLKASEGGDLMPET
ncbi:MAG: hypothetical protein AVDCRST_MAG01-01-1493 [uncultured Rubrobacteraceae bacterium]|uniref:Uncharacterized protein n=1 Tax=uncultured Rubrobacteraceae bacterium TaxID=349277 RepID=A0A6J4PAT5_9ACTN|nr:MAG: hypothetical protein AVDCRST_MAG01-01-1493 [uncultured Rubrobacteraceae bacterium]